MKEYLTIEQEFIEGRKTPIYNVWRTEGNFLGSVFWYSQWRCFVWQQEPESIMSEGCLSEMWNKIREFEAERHRLQVEGGLS